MKDPRPENIAGEKVQRHVFKHEINWGYVALSMAVLAGLWMFLRVSAGDSESEELI